MDNGRRKPGAPAVFPCLTFTLPLLFHLFATALLGLALASCSVPAAARPPAPTTVQADDEHDQPDELLVKFKPGVTEQRIAEIVDGQGTAVLELIKRVSVYRVKITNGRSVEEAVRAYSQLPEVDYAEPNYRRRGDAVHP
jgi:hypothetical protein